MRKASLLGLFLALLVASPQNACAQQGGPRATGLPESAPGAATNATVCSSGFTPNPTDAIYLEYMATYLRERIAECSAALAQLSPYIRETNWQHACMNRSGPVPGPTPIPNTGSSSQKKKNQSVYTVALNAALPALNDYDTVLAVVIDKYCAPLLAEGQGNVPTQSSLLYEAARPTVYVLIGSGGTPPSSSGAQSSGTAGPKGSSSSGGGNGGTATASTDSPDALLLFLIASDMQLVACGEAVNAQWYGSGHHFPQGTANSTYNSGCYSGGGSNVAFLPEGQWTVEDFRNQCVYDPYIHPAGGDSATALGGHGTVAGIILNGSITSRDGAFHFVDVSGGTEASFGAEVVSCNQPNASGGNPQTAWSDLIESSNTTWRISLFPFALYGTWLATLASAHASYNTLPTSTAAAAISAYQHTNTSLLVTSALSQFASGLSTTTIGNPNSGLTLHATLKNMADLFTYDLRLACADDFVYTDQRPAQAKESAPQLCAALNTNTPTFK